MRRRIAHILVVGAAAVLGVLVAALPLTVNGAAGRDTQGPLIGITARLAAAVQPTFDLAAAEEAPEGAVELPSAPAADAARGESAAPADPAPPPAPDPAPAEPTPCQDALAWVGEAGLPLPPDVGYHCPSTQFAHHGAACWNSSHCPAGGFIAVNLELIGNRPIEYLRHVVAHEVCHIYDFRERGYSTEASADACAAAHGA